MSKTSIGIDIGLNSVKVVELVKKADGNIHLAKAFIRYAPEAWDVFKDKRTVELIDYIKKAREAHRIARGRFVVASLPSTSVFVRYVDVLKSKRKKEAEVIDFEAKQQIPMPLEEVAWDYHVVSDNKRTGKKIALIAVKKDAVDEAVEIVQSAGFSSRHVSISMLCLLRLVQSKRKYRNTGGHIIVDIGAESTGILISRGKHIWLRSFQIGGKKITDSIVENAHLSYQQAEMIKKNGPGSVENIDEKLYPFIQETIAFSLETLVAEIERSINFYKVDQMNNDPSLTEESFADLTIIVTGGGAKMNGLMSFFEEKLGLPVKCLQTFSGIKIDKHVLRKKMLDGVCTEQDLCEEVDSLLAVATGAALQGFEKIDASVNFLQKQLKERQSISIVKFLRAASYLFFFGAFLTHFYYQIQETRINKARLVELEKISENMSTYGPELELIKKESVLAENRSLFFMKYLRKRFLWLEAMNAIALSLPDTLWITNFQGTGEYEGTKQDTLILQGVTSSYDQLNAFIAALRNIELVSNVKPESVVEHKDQFNFLLNIYIGKEQA